MKKLVVAGALVSLLAGACTKTTTTTTTTTPPESPTAIAHTAATIPIQVDGSSPAKTVAFTAFFPAQVTVHAGDTLAFKLVPSGEPHTVTFGSLVDTAAAVLAKTPGAPRPVTQALPAMQALPNLIADPVPGAPPGPPVVAQSAAQPCFLDAGPVPAPAACPKVAAQPDFNGTQAFYGSGWLQESTNFSVKLASTIKPGTYNYMCMLHRAAMQGQITVVPDSTTAPTAAEVAAKAKTELDAAIAKIQPALDSAKASVGVLAQTAPGAVGIVFAPKDATVPLGGSLSWTVLGPHTISINAPEDAVGVLVKEADGTVHTNPKLGTPVLAPPPAELPSKPTTVDAGKYAGAGFFNSGLILSFPPNVVTYKITFSKAGTYAVRCLVHPDMKGTIKVG